MELSNEEVRRLRNGELMMVGPNRLGLTEKGLEVERAKARAIQERWKRRAAWKAFFDSLGG